MSRRAPEPMRVALPVRGEEGLQEAVYGPEAQELARGLVREAEGAEGERRRRIVNQMHVLHELHVCFPNLRFVPDEAVERDD